MTKKIIKTEITDCLRCPNSCWSEKTDWQLLCTLLNKIITKKGKNYPIPVFCPLDDKEELTK